MAGKWNDAGSVMRRPGHAVLQRRSIGVIALQRFHQFQQRLSVESGTHDHTPPTRKMKFERAVIVRRVRFRRQTHLGECWTTGWLGTRPGVP